MIKQLLFSAIAFLFLANVQAQTIKLSPRAQISLLTCGPANEVYALYGHAALRVNDPGHHWDMVFNYGVFSFNSPHFIYRFARGETNYMLAIESYTNFYRSYLLSGRSVEEQLLNLNPAEKQKMTNFLLWNARPENREYRYNYFFDNCASRLRDVIENNVDGKISYNDQGAQKTFRRHIDQWQKPMPWINFGIQILIGSPADRIATRKEEMFLPFYLQKHMQQAVILTPGKPQRKLVTEKHILYAGVTRSSPSWWTGPVSMLGIILLLVIGISLRELKFKKRTYALDYILFVLNGLAGFLLLAFVLFSEHPAMHPNYNLCWAIPFNLLFILAWINKSWRSWLSYYWPLLSVWLLGMLFFGWLIPQRWFPEFYLLMAMLLTRSLLHSWQWMDQLRNTKNEIEDAEF